MLKNHKAPAVFCQSSCIGMRVFVEGFGIPAPQRTDVGPVPLDCGAFRGSSSQSHKTRAPVVCDPRQLGPLLLGPPVGWEPHRLLVGRRKQLLLQGLGSESARAQKARPQQ